MARPYRSYQSRLPDGDALLAAVVTVQRAFRRMVVRNRQPSVRSSREKTAASPSPPPPPPRTTTGQSSKAVVTALESKQQHFCSLYTMIGKWWKRERQRIKGIEAEHARTAAQMNLLKNEIKFLLEMEKQRLELKYELNKHDDLTFLNKTSKPRMFKTRAGKLLTVDTVGNQKARVLRDIYVELQATAAEEPVCGPDRRAAVLGRLRATVAASEYKYKDDLLAAVTMETDMTAMRAGERNVRGARSRIEQLFRHFIRQPDVNPETDAYYRPSERRVLNVYTCIRCKRNLAATDFSLESRVNRTNVCANCEWTEQVGHKRIDMAPYRRMLKALRRDEMQVAAYGSECFLMQPTEVYRLVSIVWKERSAIGDRGHLNGLRLVRWRQNEAWSPWNCVLLTRAEAEAHCRLDGDPADCYDPRFVQWVATRHMMARLQFANLVQAVKSRAAAGSKRAKPLSKNWKSVADRFNINTRSTV
ncbi:IQ and ubiquitin-like domain-containing protein [Sipha flava]|uniref:IQ and ubiquitin-like domain-containing protein n=1 Tax=Sipha flava TaxID=143950 RepID=A0A8B8FD73_9HEMI|nr:IQ and ubiquitin-like domain-containing protein [Sipha flava]